MLIVQWGCEVIYMEPALRKEHRAMLESVGQNIAYYRKKRGYTQRQLAERSSYSESYIQQIERAKVVPSMAAILSIAKALEIPEYLLFRMH